MNGCYIALSVLCAFDVSEATVVLYDIKGYSKIAACLAVTRSKLVARSVRHLSLSNLGYIRLFALYICIFEMLCMQPL